MADKSAVTCNKCGLPLAPCNRFACGPRDAVHTYHMSICKALTRLCSHQHLAETPSSNLGRFIDGLSPRTATSIRSLLAHTTLQHADQLPLAVIQHVLLLLDNGPAEQSMLIPLSDDIQNLLIPALSARLVRAGISVRTGSIIMRTTEEKEEQDEREGASGGVHVSQSIERALARADSSGSTSSSSSNSPRSASPRLPWSFVNQEPAVQLRQSQPSLRRSGRMSTRRVSALQLSTAYWNVRMLDTLDVDDTHIMQFPTTLTLHMTRLVTLVARRCGLQQLPDDMHRLVVLETLDVSNNELTALPLRLGQLARLRMLAFARNKVAVLPAALFGLPLLEVLLASTNNLTTLPVLELAALQHLQHVDVSDNQLVSVPEQLAASPSLRFLELMNNKPRLEPSPLLHAHRIVTC